MAPNITYKAFLQALKDDLVAQYSTAQVLISAAPWVKPYDKPALYIIPEGIEYEPPEGMGQTPEYRAYRVWYEAKIVGLVAITDANLESSIMSLGAKQGIVEFMESVYDHLVGNFLSLSYVREARVTWDVPAFEPAVLEGETNNWYAVLGTITYRVRLRQVQELTEQNTPPTISNVQTGTPGIDFVAITFETNEAATPRIKYGTSADSSTWTDYVDGTETGTEHGLLLSDLTPNTTYYYKCWAQDTTDLWGQEASIHSFTTESEGGGEFYAEDITATATRSAIIIEYTSSLDCACRFLVYDTEAEADVLWMDFTSEHASPHSHTKSGLAEDTTFYVKMQIIKAGYDMVSYPGDGMYFIMKTHNAGDAGGGLSGYYYP